MKLCLITSGKSIHSYRWIKYFAEKGYRIYWISLSSQLNPDFSEILKFQNLKYYQTPILSNKIFQLFKNILFVKKMVKKIQPDILHSHCAGIDGFCGALTGFHPLIITPWGSDVLIGPKSKIKRPLIKFALKKADLITCNGEVLKNEIINLGINPRKIRFIYWATDIYQFKPGIKDKKLGRKLGIFGSPTIISLRNLEPIYDIETLIRCIPLVLREMPQAKFVIAGKGSEEMKLKKLAESLGVLNNIRFVGWIPYDELPQYLALAEVYVSTSLSDGDLSQCTQQAMACEIPIITTDIEVNKRRIKDRENGLIVPTKDPKSLADKIVLLLRDKKLKFKLGKAGREIIVNQLNYYKEMEKAEILYQELAKKFNK
jgi:glycosyltransferase involved in cell wall biosynthesis